MSSIVEVRLYSLNADESDWKSVNVNSYMPTFLNTEIENIENVTKRIKLLYLITSDVKARWNFKDSPEKGYWVK